MTAYDFTSTNTIGAKKRRFALPNLRVAGFGGGLGLLVVAIGLIAIGLGWNGMAGGGGQLGGVSDLRAQLPWLVSGGLLGLALVVFGAALMIVHNARTDRARLEAKLDEVIAGLGRTAAPSIAYPTDPTAAASTATAGVYLAGASSYHRPDCRLVQGRDDAQAVTMTEVADQGLRACRVCKPSETISR
jgi:hypothetical protein